MKRKLVNETRGITSQTKLKRRLVLWIQNKIGFNTADAPLCWLEVDMDWFLIVSLWILSLFGAVFFGHETARIVHKMDKEYIELSDNEKLRACHDVIAGIRQ